MGAAPAGFPTITVNVAFATTPFALTPTYTDITDWVMGFSTKRGRSDELQAYSAGTLNLTLDNQDGRFDPTNASSPYWPNVVPMRLVQVKAVWSAITYVIFTGYIDGWPPTWPLNKLDRMTVTATDAFKVLTRTNYVNPAQPEETIASRVGEILTVANIGSSHNGSQTIVAADAIQSIALSYLQQLEQTEGGSLFMDESGLLRFEERHYRSNNKLSVLATFGDGDSAGELPYTVLEPLYDDTQLINDQLVTASKATWPLAAPAEYSDAASELAYGPSAVTTTLDMLVRDSNEAADMAWARVQRFKTPAVRFNSLTFMPAISGTLLWPQALGRVFGDLIECIRRTPGGNTIDQDCHIDSIAHTWDGNSMIWTTQWGLSPKAAAVSGWRLDDTVNGKWDTTTVLSY